MYAHYNDNILFDFDSVWDFEWEGALCEDTGNKEKDRVVEV